MRISEVGSSTGKGRMQNQRSKRSVPGHVNLCRSCGMAVSLKTRLLAEVFDVGIERRHYVDWRKIWLDKSQRDAGLLMTVQ